MKAQIVVSLLIIALTLWAQSCERDTSRPVRKTIFAIGQEDRHWGEFTARGFKGHPEYRCRVGVDCSTENFPSGLYLRDPNYSFYADEEVKRVIITFVLENNYNELVLRLVRGGSETTVVTVDGTQTYLVTNEMLGSSDGWVVGDYDLKLGAFKKGTHTLELSIADDGRGDGSFGWDALALFAR
jgi:hypothetical protein